MDGTIVIGTELDTKSFEYQIKEIENELKQIDYELSHKKELRLDSRTIDEYKRKAELLSNKLVDLKKKQDDLNRTGFTNIQGQLSNIGNSINGITGKVVRWGLAVFGIRSAYNFVRNSISTVAQYNDQIGADVEYIRFALANALLPVIKTIINFAYKLLYYTSAILKAWFGIDLFAKSGADAFKSAKDSTGGISKGLGKATKQAKELNKQLAGFDEMNVLQDNTSDTSGGGAGGGTGGGGFTMPSFDLSAMQMETPGWLQWIIDHKDIILAILAGIAAGLLAIKLELSGIQALGIGIAVAGIVYAIEKLIAFLNNPTFENFLGILKGIAVAVAGIGIAISSLPLAIGGAIALIILLIVEHFEEIKKLFDNLIKWMDKNVLGALRTLFGPLGNILYIPIKYFVELARGAFESFYGGVKQVINGVMQIFKGNFLSGIKNIFGGLLNIMTAPLQGFLRAVKSIIPMIVNLFVQIGTKVGQVIASAFKAVVNGVLAAIENVLNSPIKTVNKLIKVINALPGINLGTLPTFKLPRLAKGGIVNMPGNGVPVGGAIAGESGREGVIPLTDSQQMMLLGEAIGKYITINATITNTMNGRVISRELQRINNESDFAYNR